MTVFRNAQAPAHLLQRVERESTVLISPQNTSISSFYVTVTHRLILQFLLLLRHAPPRQPTPARQTPSRRMKDAEIISIPHAGHASDKTPLAEEAGADVACGGNAAQVAAVEGVEGEACAGEDEGWDHVFGGGEEL